MNTTTFALALRPLVTLARTGALTLFAASALSASASASRAPAVFAAADQIGGPGFVGCNGDLNEVSSVMPVLSSAAIEEFTMPTNATMVTQVDVVLRTPQGGSWPTVQFWTVSVFASVNQAENSGSAFSSGAVATTFTNSATMTYNYAPNCVSGTSNALCQVPVNFVLQPGLTYWVVCAPVTNAMPTLRLARSNYSAGFPNGNNGVWINPDNGWGLGTSVATNANSAVRVIVQ
ncbi:MAG: hypothetical protein JST30_05445 [Armatimonadetes bacterium]|nr:hypothetical protein [Armatimonadota bacterium]